MAGKSQRVDSGFRRNDGWGSRNDGKIGMTGKSQRVDSGLRRNDGWGSRNDGKIGMTEKIKPLDWKRYRLIGNATDGGMTEPSAALAWYK